MSGTARINDKAPFYNYSIIQLLIIIQLFH